ncbi:hypothetical protein [Streptomyces capitiformicae]|uniref:Uncharacterized protein n=1 Tax=Streptomyces capitiformicae TaxID=2014920 RepID=A0A918ZH44_9ACTN|nr:hypothetical protein [Streptomyces capitiformicae]GHE51496.1 hypothetical protein GCM10017771_73750 [Streptomyces capitiformicae]
MDDEFGPVVASYTWEEAFEDGAFISIPPAAATAAGIEMPLAITAGARREFVEGGDGDEDDRLRTVLSAVARAVKRGPDNEVCFVVPAEELPSGQASTGADELLAITQPADSGGLILTLMLPDEM